MFSFSCCRNRQLLEYERNNLTRFTNAPTLREWQSQSYHIGIICCLNVNNVLFSLAGWSPGRSLFKMKLLFVIPFFILISLCVEEAYSKEKSSKKGKGKKKQYLCPSYVLHVLYILLFRNVILYWKGRTLLKWVWVHIYIRTCAHFYFNSRTRRASYCDGSFSALMGNAC